jgi:hypothetical protein
VELRLAALMHLPRTGPTSLPAMQVLELATLNGAKALGLEGEIGVLEGNSLLYMLAKWVIKGEWLPSPASFGGVALVFLLARAFSSGTTALTGIEAISNGVPAFREPEARNYGTYPFAGAVLGRVAERLLHTPRVTLDTPIEADIHQRNASRVALELAQAQRALLFADDRERLLREWVLLSPHLAAGGNGAIEAAKERLVKESKGAL